MSYFKLEALKGAMTADKLKKTRKKWKPDLRLTGNAQDKKFVYDVNEILLTHGKDVEAYQLSPPTSGAFSLQLQFTDTRSSTRAAALWSSFRETDVAGEDEADDVYTFLLEYAKVGYRFEADISDVDRLAKKARKRLPSDFSSPKESRIAVWAKLAEAVSEGKLASKSGRELIQGLICLLYNNSDLPDAYETQSAIARISNPIFADPSEFHVEVRKDDPFLEADVAQLFSMTPCSRAELLNEERAYLVSRRLHEQLQRNVPATALSSRVRKGAMAKPASRTAHSLKPKPTKAKATSKLTTKKAEPVKKTANPKSALKTLKAKPTQKVAQAKKHVLKRSHTR